MKNIVENYEIISINNKDVVAKTILQYVCPCCGHTTHQEEKMTTIPRKMFDDRVKTVEKLLEEILSSQL